MRFVRCSGRPDHVPRRTAADVDSSPTRPRTSGSGRDERARLVHAVWVPLARELLKLAVIAIYVGFATWLAFAHRNPAGFAPLLPWALGVSPGLAGLLNRGRIAPHAKLRPQGKPSDDLLSDRE